MKTPTALAVLALVTLLPAPIAAQDDGSPWVRPAIKKRCYRHIDMWGAVTYPCYRHSVRDYGHRDYGPQVYGYERHEREYDREFRRYSSGPDLHPSPNYGPRCKERIVTAVGFEYANEDRALKSAQLIYAATVRQEYGEMFQEITQARDVLTLCTQASVNDTAVGRLGDALIGESAVLKRCKIWARPCRPEIERASFGKDKEDDVRKNDPPARAERYEEKPPRKHWYDRYRLRRGN